MATGASTRFDFSKTQNASWECTQWTDKLSELFTGSPRKYFPLFSIAESSAAWQSLFWLTSWTPLHDPLKRGRGRGKLLPRITRLVAPVGPSPKWEQFVPLFRVQLHCSNFDSASFQLISPLWGQGSSYHLPWCLHPGTTPSFSKDQALIPVHYAAPGKALPIQWKGQNR